MSDTDKINDLELSLQHAEEAISSLTSTLRRIQVEQAELSSNVSGLDETVEINRENVAQLDRWRETFNAMDYLDEGRAVWFESIGRRTVINARMPKKDFGVHLSAADTVTVAGGLVKVMPNIFKDTLAEADLTLSGSNEWIYVKITRNPYSASIEHVDLDSDTGPSDDDNTIKWPLAKYEASGGIYTRVRTCWEGVIICGSPL